MIMKSEYVMKTSTTNIGQITLIPLVLSLAAEIHLRKESLARYNRRSYDTFSGKLKAADAEEHAAIAKREAIQREIREREEAHMFDPAEEDSWEPVIPVVTFLAPLASISGTEIERPHFPGLYSH